MKIAKMMRAVEIPVTGEVVEARKSSIEKFLEKKISMQQAEELIRLYYTGECEQNFLDEFVTNFQEDDNTFADDCKEELRILAGICVDELMECDYRQDEKILAFLGFYARMYEFLGYESKVAEISEHLKNALNSSMKKLREELPVKQTKTITSLSNSIKFNNANVETEYTEEVAEKLDNIVKKLNDVIKIIKKTELQSKIVFEDTQLLWWMTTGFSDIMEMKYVDIARQERRILPVIIGSELAELISVFPGPYAAKALLRKMLEILPKEEAKEESLECYIDSVEDKVIQQIMGENQPQTPMLYALGKKLENGEGNWKQSFLKKYELKKESFAPLEIAYETYIECMIANS